MKTINLICLAVVANVVSVVANIEFGQKFDRVNPHILGGNDAKEGQFSYQVSLRSRKGHFCGGAIISNRFILSAAHCMQGPFASPNLVYAVVGTIYSSKDGVYYRLSTIKSHPEYDKKKSLNDLAILRTTEEIIFSNLIQPVALPKMPSSHFDNNFILSGWGCSKQPHPMQKPTMSDLLKFIMPATLSTKDCIEKFKGHQTSELVRDTNICTISPVDVGTCFGDSGNLS
ncbi:chymotrypsin-2-like [Contarinia nasturtii]|uniref:chymotrypsin-2-like n=1 Tax=Contarinia nasturtii TaxID=265458 RepID=UPI0012D3E151|nr:chymotrypsin-2-like [Contarinia nasturtii]